MHIQTISKSELIEAHNVLSGKQQNYARALLEILKDYSNETRICSVCLKPTLVTLCTNEWKHDVFGVRAVE